MKILKCDWHSKLSEENNETLLHIKVKGPKREYFIKEDTTDAAAFWWDAKEQGKEGMVNGKKYKKRSTKTKRLRFANKLTDIFFESSSDEDGGNVI